ncbi:MAG TPA: homoserine O-succinyltransferase [Thioalkalivibrio sp.]|nr:homoserine O-succinyltransferase [Thioalkalivibrio sp.]
MPLVAHTALPAFERLSQEGATVLPSDYALHQDIRALHIGLLNMMPDAALAATERQFFRLIGESNQIAQFYMHPFTLAELPRGPGGQAHVEQFYESFETIQRDGLDALIITGANVNQPDLALEPFWEPLAEVVDWAWHNVTSTLCSCLATHAVMQARYGERRHPRGPKLWGVFDHRVVERGHPLVAGVNTRFDVPHSRFNDVSRAQFERHGLKVLVDSETAGVHLAVSEDGFRLVFFQGHPEYDSISLLKEYKREVGRYINGACPDFPPLPDHYLAPQAAAILGEHRERVEHALMRRAPAPELPEHLLLERLDNTWHDSALAVVNNWIGHVYQLTNVDRRLPFRQGIDPNDPLGLAR